MRIKQVCCETGLTDRTVRYYIEEGLIFPEYTENYLGRRNFDFSQTDVKALKDIAVLRKFGFTVDEIRSMQLCPEMTDQTVIRLKDRKREAIDTERELLERLDQYEEGADMSELAEFLASPVKDKRLPCDDGNLRLKDVMLRMLRQAGLVLLTTLSMVLFAVGFLTVVGDYYYPQLRPLMLILGIVTLLPSVVVWLLPKTRLSRNKPIRAVCLALCLIAIPCSLICGRNIYSDCSKTEDISNYRAFDPQCIAARARTFQELFPQQPQYNNARYYYRYHSDFGLLQACDIYAEWTLPENNFAEEVERVRSINGGSVWQEVQRGDYTCLFDCSTGPIFEDTDGKYTYYIFAYNEKTLTVRYFYCFNGEDKSARPYYTDVEWQ